MSQQQGESTFDWASREIAGNYSSPQEAAARLRMAAKHCHLIGGMAITPMIEGHDVQITVIPINEAECYPIRGRDGDPPKKGIPRSVLMNIANAAGVEWSAPVRVDDGTDPHYCHIKVSGRYMTIDGTHRPIEGERDSDLRAGSDQMSGKKEGEIGALRSNMLRSTITKARLRALRDAFGVSQGMLESELHKPFVFAKAVFTGRSSNPQTAQMFAQVIAYQKLAGTVALYGGTMPTLSLPTYQAPSTRQLQAHVVDCDENGEVIEHAPQAPGPVAPPPPPPPRPASAPRNGNGNGGGKAFTWPFEPKKEGDVAKGTPFKDCPTEQLKYLASYCEKKAAEGGQYADSDAAKAKAARAEIASRSASAPAPTTSQAPVAGDRGENGDNW